MRRQLRCGLLLELPHDLEARFWSDEGTLRTYVNWDTYICVYLLCANLALARVMMPLLCNTSLLASSWHVHFTLLTNIASVTANLVLILRYRQLYLHHRRKIVLSQRVLRLSHGVINLLFSGQPLLTAQANALNRHVMATDGTSTLPSLATAVASLTRPLVVSPAVIMAHGNWLLRTKVWLPFQVLTVVLALMNTQRHQHCRMANDPSSALLLQPTCRAMSGLLQSIAGSLLGPVFLGLQPQQPLTNDAACSDMAASARMLAAYVHTAYGLLVPLMGVWAMEWRLKAKWAKEKLGEQQLVYGPLGFPRSNAAAPVSFTARLLSLLAWMRCVGALWLLWIALTWLVPRLPYLPCPTCEDTGTCGAIAPCDHAVCRGPGYLAAAVMHGEMLVVHLGHLASTYFA